MIVDSNIISWHTSSTVSPVSLTFTSEILFNQKSPAAMIELLGYYPWLIYNLVLFGLVFFRLWLVLFKEHKAPPILFTDFLPELISIYCM